MKKFLSNIVYYIIALILVIGVLYVGLHHSNAFIIIFNILGVLILIVALGMIVKKYIGSGIGLLLMAVFILILNNSNVKFTPIRAIFCLVIFCSITYLYSVLADKYDKKKSSV